MRAACYILFFLFFTSSLYSQQFYIRGEVKDESGNPLQNVNILIQTTGMFITREHMVHLAS